ncbi:MAG TPA: hypothetical protein VE569_10465 [Acidimicrobiia bacterium]|jgi:hypothetical protein|nr:hypothetical protein [Acidimicrobiia bacterium]
MLKKEDRISTFGVTLAVFALSLTACGTTGSADNGTDGVASLSTDTTTQGQNRDDTSGDSSGEVDAPTDPHEAFLLYDQCMAEQGFPTDAAGQVDKGPAVVTNGAGGDSGAAPTEHMVGPGGIEIAPEELEEFDAANQVCQKHLANMTQGQEFTPEQQAAMEDATLRVQQCMNDKGFDVQLGAGGDEQTLSPQDEDDEATAPDQGQVDPEDLDEAMEECSKIFDEYPELDEVPMPGRDE